MLPLSAFTLKSNSAVSPAAMLCCAANDVLVHTPLLFFTTARAHASAAPLADSFVTGTLIFPPLTFISFISG